jgi:hypothetical protein
LDEFPKVLTPFLQSFSSRGTTFASVDVLVKISVVTIAILDIHHSIPAVLTHTMTLITGLINACIKRIHKPQEMSLVGMYSVLWILLSGVSTILAGKEDIEPLFSRYSSVWTQIAPILSRLDGSSAEAIIGLDWELAGFTPMKSVIGDIVSPYTRFDRVYMDRVAVYFTTGEEEMSPVSILRLQDGGKDDVVRVVEDVLGSRIRAAGNMFAQAFPWCLEARDGGFVYVGGEGSEEVEEVDCISSEDSVEVEVGKVDEEVEECDDEMRGLMVSLIIVNTLATQERSWGNTRHILRIDQDS